MTEIYLNRRQQNLARDYEPLARSLADKFFDKRVHGYIENAHTASIIALCRAAYHFDGRMPFNQYAYKIIKNCLVKNYKSQIKKSEKLKLHFTEDLHELLTEAPPEPARETPVFQRLKVFLTELEYNILWDVFMDEIDHQDILKKYSMTEVQWNFIISEMLAKIRLVGFDRITQEEPLEPLDMVFLKFALDRVEPMSKTAKHKIQRKMWKK